MKKCIFTMQTEEHDIIKHAIDLHVKSKQIDYDPTYSKGVSYNKGINQPKFKSDKIDTCCLDFVCDFRNTPFSDKSIDSIFFDPPFIYQKTTPSRVVGAKNRSKMVNRFSKYETKQELEESYISGFTEFYRILRKKGILIIKCQDYLESTIQFWAHIFVFNELEKLNFRIIDMFIKHRTYGVIWNPLKTQRHARKNHTYFIVAKKLI